MAEWYGEFQNQIYAGGMRGVMPRFPHDYAALEAKAQATMPPWVHSYVAGGAGSERTQRANVEAFDKFGIVPRMLVGAEQRDLSVELFGLRLPSPIFMAPVGVIGLCAQDLHGDLLVAEAAARTGVPMMASTLSQDPMESVAARFGDTPGFFQLYPPKDRDLCLSLISRAEKAGFRALTITLDTWVNGWRPRDLDNANLPMLRGLCLANYLSDDAFLARLERAPAEDPMAVAATWAQVFGGVLTWDDLAWIRQATDLPLVLKGICHPDDARRAVDLGVDAIYCSNHGGRQANGGLSALELLPGVVAACSGAPVLFDSGVRTGSDIVKALAMGATAVGVGRPYAYALALGGSAGVEHQLRSLLAEADLLMAIDGFATVADLRAAGVVRAI